MTGITNRAGCLHCDICGTQNHWKAMCPNYNKDNTLSKPKLVEVGNGDAVGGKDNSKRQDATNNMGVGGGGWFDAEGVVRCSKGVTLVTHERESHAPSLIWLKVYIDSCALHCQLFLWDFLYGKATTQVALYSSSNGGPSTFYVTGTILGAFPCWLVESGIADLVSVGAVEQLDCKVEKQMGKGWLLTLPARIHVQFQLDTGRCCGFPCVDLRDPDIHHLFSKIAKELATAINNAMVANHTHVDAFFCKHEGLLTANDWLRYDTAFLAILTPQLQTSIT